MGTSAPPCCPRSRGWPRSGTAHTPCSPGCWTGRHCTASWPRSTRSASTSSRSASSHHNANHNQVTAAHRDGPHRRGVQNPQPGVSSHDHCTRARHARRPSHHARKRSAPAHRLPPSPLAAVVLAIAEKWRPQQPGGQLPVLRRLRGRRGTTGCPTRERWSMNGGCTHLDRIHDVTPSSWGCEDCLAQGRRDWVHLRVCQECGHVGCCDNSPGRHATAHFRVAGHPVIRSYEPGEDWYWCYLDQLAFELEGAPPAPSHP